MNISAATLKTIMDRYDWFRRIGEPKLNEIEKYCLPTDKEMRITEATIFGNDETNRLLLSDKDYNMPYSWEYVVVTIMTDKFELIFKFRNDSATVFLGGIAELAAHCQVTLFAWENREITVNYKNGGTEEDIILFIMGT